MLKNIAALAMTVVIALALVWATPIDQSLGYASAPLMPAAAENVSAN